MKLYNKTKYPDDLLQALLIEAGKAIGARTSKVIVIVTSGKPGYPYTRGVAQRCDYVRHWALETRAYKKGTYELKKGEVETDGGYFRLTIPYPFTPDWVKNSQHYQEWKAQHRGIDRAEQIFSTACHEWQHIRQYQTLIGAKGSFIFSNRKERRKHHDNRAWEKDAIKAASKVKTKPRSQAQEAILNLAIWLEEV